MPAIRHSQGSHIDTRTVFDSISTRLDIPPKTRNRMLYRLLEGIIAHFSVDDILHYKEYYVELTGDSIRAENMLIEQNIIQVNGRGIMQVNNKDTQLRDKNGNEITFEALKEQLYGKVIYLSFWASWCAPCMRSMSYAKLLREEFQEKDAVFVYLAFNDDKGRWKTAKQQVGLSDFARSYFILNSRTAPMITDLNVRTLPRYLLFNRQGELVHSNAPGPQGVKIRELLNSLLKEN